MSWELGFFGCAQIDRGCPMPGFSSAGRSGFRAWAEWTGVSRALLDSSAALRMTGVALRMTEAAPRMTGVGGCCSVKGRAPADDALLARRLVGQFLDGCASLRVHDFSGDFGQGNQDKSALHHTGMGYLEVGSFPINVKVGQQQDIDVDGTGAVPDPGSSPQVPLNLFHQTQQGSRAQGSGYGNGAIEEPGLLKEAPGFGFVKGGTPFDSGPPGRNPAIVWPGPGYPDGCPDWSPSPGRR